LLIVILLSRIDGGYDFRLIIEAAWSGSPHGFPQTLAPSHSKYQGQLYQCFVNTAEVIARFPAEDESLPPGCVGEAGELIWGISLVPRETTKLLRFFLINSLLYC
jgi:hypothetical protein